MNATYLQSHLHRKHPEPEFQKLKLYIVIVYTIGEFLQFSRNLFLAMDFIDFLEH